MGSPATFSSNSALDGLEPKLWAAADALRNNMDAAEYKHVVLGLIFLKYISDAFEAKHAELSALQATEGADPEDPDEYRAENIFWVPKEARWSVLKDNAPQPTIGKLVDDAMAAIERDNKSLQGVLPEREVHPGRQTQQGWGTKVIERVARDLKATFPDMKGFSTSNLKYMRYFAEHCPDVQFGQQPADQLPWFHIVTLLTRLDVVIPANLKELAYGE